MMVRECVRRRPWGRWLSRDPVESSACEARHLVAHPPLLLLLPRLLLLPPLLLGLPTRVN